MKIGRITIFECTETTEEMQARTLKTLRLSDVQNPANRNAAAAVSESERANRLEAEITRLRSTLQITEQERDEARASSREKVHRAFKIRKEDGSCGCPYCTGNLELLGEMVGNYELDKATAEWKLATLETCEYREEGDGTACGKCVQCLTADKKAAEAKLTALLTARDRLVAEMREAIGSSAAVLDVCVNDWADELASLGDGGRGQEPDA